MSKGVWRCRSRARSRPIALAATVLLAAGGLGCGPRFNADFVRTGPIPVQTTPAGRLTSGPTPLTLSSIRRLSPSPRSAVLRILFDTEWGFFSSATARQHPAIRRAVGISALEDGFRQVRNNVLLAQPVVSSQRRYGKGVVVSIKMLTSDSAPYHELFALVRRRGRWMEAYNTLLLLGVAVHAESKVQSLEKPLSDTALRAGGVAVRRYRKVASQLLGAPLPGPATP